MADVPDPGPSELDRLRRRLDRERKARLESEAIAEHALRQLYTKQREVDLLRAIAVAANESSTIEDAMQICVERVCAYTSWPVGHVYLLTEDSPDLLVPTTIWHLDDPDRFSTFRQVTESTPLARGIGLPGRVLASGKPAWIMDVTKDANFPRAKIATDIGVRAGFGFPVLVGAEAVGALEFFSPEAVEPDESLLEVMAHIGTQLGRVVERKRASDALQNQRNELRRLSRNLEQLYALSIAIQEPLSLKEQLGRVLEGARQVVDIDRFYIWALTGEASTLAPLAGAGFVGDDWDAIERTRIPLEASGAMHKAYREGVPLVFNEQNPLPAELRLGPPYSELPALRTKSFLVLPMIARGRTVGLFTADNKRSGRPILPKTVRLLETFATHAAVAVENARLFEELQARTRDLARSVEELRALGEVGQAVSSTLDLETVLTTIVTRAVQLSSTSAGVIYEYDEAAQEFHLRATHGVEPELDEVIQGTRIRLGEGALGRAGLTRAPVQVPDIPAEDAVILPLIRPILIGSGYRSLLAVPLLSEPEIIGGLLVWRREAGRFSAETVALLQTFATQSVLAIRNARLFREIEEKGRQLEVASRHKSQFLANMSHELRTPMNAVLGYVELVLDNIFGEVPQPIRDILERTRNNGVHLLGLINDVLDLSKIEAGQLTLSLGEYSMEDVVRTAVHALESLASEKRLAMKIEISPGLPIGRGDAQRLTQVLLNLVGNAIKFTEAGEVRVEARTADEAFLVSVSDTGPGIAEGDRLRIFEEFQQADSSNTRKKGGTGLGLAIAKRIVEIHGGRIGVESSVGQGSTFWFRLPIHVDRHAAAR